MQSDENRSSRNFPNFCSSFSDPYDHYVALQLECFHCHDLSYSYDLSDHHYIVKTRHQGSEITRNSKRVIFFQMCNLPEFTCFSRAD